MQKQGFKQSSSSNSSLKDAADWTDRTWTKRTDFYTQRKHDDLLPLAFSDPCSPVPSTPTSHTKRHTHWSWYKYETANQLFSATPLFCLSHVLLDPYYSWYTLTYLSNQNSHPQGCSTAPLPACKNLCAGINIRRAACPFLLPFFPFFFLLYESCTRIWRILWVGSHFTGGWLELDGENNVISVAWLRFGARRLL